MLPADELSEILRPGVGDAGPIGDDQDFMEPHTDNQIIGGQGLAKPGLCVPEEFRAAALKVFLGVMDSPFLFCPQLVGQALLIRLRSLSAGKSVEILLRGGPVDLEPLGSGPAGRAGFGFQPVMEGVVCEVFPGAILVHGIVCPEELPPNSGSMGLFVNPVCDPALGVADFSPAVVIGHAGGVVGIDRRNDPLEGVDLGHLFHLLYMGFDEGNLCFIQAVLPVELLIDLRNGAGPVDVGGGGEVLEGNHSPCFYAIVLSYFQCA